MKPRGIAVILLIALWWIWKEEIEGLGGTVMSGQHTRNNTLSISCKYECVGQNKSLEMLIAYSSLGCCVAFPFGGFRCGSRPRFSMGHVMMLEGTRTSLQTVEWLPDGLHQTFYFPKRAWAKNVDAVVSEFRSAHCCPHLEVSGPKEPMCCFMSANFTSFLLDFCTSDICCEARRRRCFFPLVEWQHQCLTVAGANSFK